MEHHKQIRSNRLRALKPEDITRSKGLGEIEES